MVKVALNLTANELQIFLKELDQHINEIERCVVELEQVSDHKTQIEQLFRSFHTIKGNAGIAEYHLLKNLAHEVENVLSKFRASGNSIPPSISDLILKSSDLIKVLRNHLDNDKVDINEDEVNLLVATIKDSLSALNSAPHKKQNEPQSITPLHKEVADNKRLTLEVYLSSKEMLPAVRLFQIVHALDQENIKFTSTPTVEDIQNANITLPLIIHFPAIPTNFDKFMKNMMQIDGLTAVKKIYPLPEAPKKTEPQKEEIKKEDESTKALASQKSSSAQTPTQVAQEEMQEVQINIKKLDSLITLLGEILIDRNKIFQNIIELEEKYTLDPQIAELLDLISHLGKITYNLQTELLNVRTIPLSNIIEKYPRLIRDLAKNLGKKVRLEIVGQHVELDRMILKYLNDMMIHLIRNAIDHGIEAPDERLSSGKKEIGLIKIEAFQKHNKANFVISDDGKGIDPKIIKKIIKEKNLVDSDTLESLTNSDLIKYIFHPGFSTKSEISDISGRGVGMDVVQNTIQKLGGQITVESEVGKGSKFRVALPLTLAIVHGLVSVTDSRTFIIPISYVDEVVRCAGSDLKVLNKKNHIVLREKVIPLVSLKQVLYQKEVNLKTLKKIFVVIVNYNDQQTGIVVDKLIGEEEIVIKNIDVASDKYYIIHSATIMGTGDIGLILDIGSLLDFVTLKKDKLEEQAKPIIGSPL